MSLPRATRLTYGSELRCLEAGNLRVTECTHLASRRIPRHAHDAALLSLVIDGAYKERYGQQLGASGSN
jgi:hypothetical protein